MSNLNTEEIKRFKKGEFCGLLATVGAGVACIELIVFLSVAIALSRIDLRIYALGVCIPLMGVFALLATVFNLKYGKALDRIINNYVRDIFVENAALMHPERDSLTYYISNDGRQFFVKANNFKELITFDFSAFGKLSAVRKATITTAIIERLGTTYCRLMERGGKYKTVSYAVIKNGTQSKTVNIIENGAPDKKIYKNYLKQQ